MTSRALERVLGSWSPATAGFFNYTLSRPPWRARNVPDGITHTLGMICTLNIRIKQRPTTRNSERVYPNSDERPIRQY